MRQNDTLKGQSNEIFDLQFFHNSNQLGPLTDGLKMFSILVKFSLLFEFSLLKN